MWFEITSSGPLTGRVTIPGDLKLTLALMAFGMLSTDTITVRNPSPSPCVGDFRRFLECHGAEFNDSLEAFSIRGKPWKGDIILGAGIPDEVVHIVAGASIFSARSVRIVDGAFHRSSLVEHLRLVLGHFGLTEENISVEDSDVVFKDVKFSVPDGIVSIRSAWALETACAAACISHKVLTLSYPSHVVSHSVKLLNLMGCSISNPVNVSVRETELTRRMAKHTGETPPEIRRFEWNCRPQETIIIPGDTSIAAAVAGAAAVLQKSDIIIEGILWEQGRRGFFDALRRMKGKVTANHVSENSSFDAADIHVSWSKLEGIHLTAAHARTMISELLILCSIAAQAGGETVISDASDMPGIGRESFSCVSRGLVMFGVQVGDYADGIVIKGGNELHGDLVDACGRPDAALALSIAGLNAAKTTTVFGYDDINYPVSLFLRIVRTLSGE